MMMVKKDQTQDETPVGNNDLKSKKYKYCSIKQQKNTDRFYTISFCRIFMV